MLFSIILSACKIFLVSFYSNEIIIILSNLAPIIRELTLRMNHPHKLLCCHKSLCQEMLKMSYVKCTSISENSCNTLIIYVSREMSLTSSRLNCLSRNLAVSTLNYAFVTKKKGT